MVGWCHHCGKSVSESEVTRGAVAKIGRDRYAHTRCIDNKGKENTMNDQTQHILGAADSAHQGIELARSLIQESLGNMGEILTQGCMELGAASLGSTMRLGQQLKELNFLLADLLCNAHGLCVLLGKDLGVCESEDVEPASEELAPKKWRALWYKSSCVLGDHVEPGEDEFDDDEQPF